MSIAVLGQAACHGTVNSVNFYVVHYVITTDLTHLPCAVLRKLCLVLTTLKTRKSQLFFFLVVGIDSCTVCCVTCPFHSACSALEGITKHRSSSAFFFWLSDLTPALHGDWDRKHCVHYILKFQFMIFHKT